MTHLFEALRAIIVENEYLVKNYDINMIHRPCILHIKLWCIWYILLLENYMIVQEERETGDKELQNKDLKIAVPIEER